MRAHYSDIAVNLLGLWEQGGNVELYFKHHYKEFNYRMEKLISIPVAPELLLTVGS
jgi:hypothetical protein